MNRLEEKSIKVLNERFPYHNLNDENDLELQQFTAEDMIDFALYVAQASLEKASENAATIYTNHEQTRSKVFKPSITHESNIVIL